MSRRICNTCGLPFTPKGRMPGFKGQCFECGVEAEEERDVRRHVGLQGGAGANKSGAIGIFRHPSDELAAQVRRINCGGYHANTGLGLNSQAAAAKTR